ncbi:MAG: radical SAM protein [Lentisphaerota bacterium]
MNFSHTLFRPPAEADSLILRIADGCPWNQCAFCGMYKGVSCVFQSLEKITRDISNHWKKWPEARRIFLADGDVMHLDFQTLETILVLLNNKFARLARVSLYANGASILAKTDEQLHRLKALKLHTLYMGLESGDDLTLHAMKKRETAADMILAGQRAQAAGLRMSVMALIGLAGTERSHEHACATAAALNQMQPRLFSALRLIVTPNTPLARNGFKMLTEYEAVSETRELIQRLDLEQTIFRADHASNIIPLEARLPRDKSRLLGELDTLLASGRLDQASPGRMPFWL